jgi:hypothetical protein
MKRFLTFVLILNGFVISAQNASTTPPESSKNIQGLSNDVMSTVSDRHKLTPGTHISLVPPKGWKVSTKLAGYEGPDGSSVLMAFEVPVAVEKSINDLMNGNTATERGFKPVYSNRFTMNGYKAARYIGSNGAVEMHMMAFGDETFTVFLNGVYKADDPNAQQEMVSALNTTIYSKEIKVEPLSQSHFYLSFEDYGYKFVTNVMGSIYMFEPKENIGAENQRKSFMVMQVPNDGNMTLDGLAEQLMGKMAEKGMNNSKILSDKKVSINGLEAIEKVISTQKEGSDKGLMYIMTLQSTDYLFAMMGTAGDEKEATINNFKQLAATFNLKK